jgi:hypothetical protein
VGSARDLLAHRLNDQGMGVPHHHDPEAVVKIDVLVAVHIPHAAPQAVINEDWLRSGILEGGRNASGADLARFAPELVRLPPRRPEPLFLARDQGLDPIRIDLGWCCLVCHQGRIVSPTLDGG